MAAVLFILLISRDDQPLYIQSFETDPKSEKNTESPSPSQAPDASIEDSSANKILAQEANQFLKYNFLSHMALDIFASPMSLHLRELQGDPDGILLLFIQDDVTVYGMETNNGLKLVVGMSEEISIRSKLKQLFLHVHKAYLKTVCNPFTNVLTDGDHLKMLQTTTFDTRMKTLVHEWMQ